MTANRLPTDIVCYSTVILARAESIVVAWVLQLCCLVLTDVSFYAEVDEGVDCVFCSVLPLLYYTQPHPVRRLLRVEISMDCNSK